MASRLDSPSAQAQLDPATAEILEERREAERASLAHFDQDVLAILALPPVWTYDLVDGTLKIARQTGDVGLLLDRAMAANLIDPRPDPTTAGWTMGIAEAPTDHPSKLDGSLEELRHTDLLDADWEPAEPSGAIPEPSPNAFPVKLAVADVTLRSCGCRFWSPQPLRVNQPVLISIFPSQDRSSSLKDGTGRIVACRGEAWSGYQVVLSFGANVDGSREFSDWLARMLYAEFHAPGEVRQMLANLAQTSTAGNLLERTQFLARKIARQIAGSNKIAASSPALAASVATALPVALHRWAELARAEDPADFLSGELDRLLNTAASTDADTGEAQAWLETGALLAPILRGRLDAIVRLGERRLEFAWRRFTDARLLAKYVERPEQVDAFRRLITPDTTDWALHYLGSGGVGKTMLFRHLCSLCSRLGLRFSRIDFDYLRADFPVLRPGQLLLDLALGLLTAGGGAGDVDRRFIEFIDHAEEFYKEVDHVRPGSQPDRLFAIRVSQFGFDQLLRSFVALLQATHAPMVVLFLDTCEELARQPDGLAVTATFEILERIQALLHEQRKSNLDVPQLRVIFAGRRLLATQGAGWKAAGATSAGQPRPYLQAYELRGFSEADANVLFTNSASGLSPALRRAILRRSVESGFEFQIQHVPTAHQAGPKLEAPADPKGILSENANARNAAPPSLVESRLQVIDLLRQRLRPRYSPFDLDLYAELFQAVPTLTEDDVVNGPDPYVETRLLNRLRTPEVTQAVPYLVLLRRVEFGFLSEVMRWRVNTLTRIRRELCQLEWLHPQAQAQENDGESRVYLNVGRNHLPRLQRHFSLTPSGRADANPARDLEIARKRLVPQLRKRLSGTFADEAEDILPAAMRLLPVEEAATIWARWEQSVSAQSNAWDRAWRVTNELLGPEGGLQPELHAHVLSTRLAAAIQTERDRTDFRSGWERVLDEARRHPDHPSNLWILDLAIFGHCAAAFTDGLEPAPAAWAECNRLIAALTQQLAPDRQSSHHRDLNALPVPSADANLLSRSWWEVQQRAAAAVVTLQCLADLNEIHARPEAKLHLAFLQLAKRAGGAIGPLAQRVCARIQARTGELESLLACLNSLDAAGAHADPITGAGWAGKPAVASYLVWRDMPGSAARAAMELIVAAQSSALHLALRDHLSGSLPRLWHEAVGLWPSLDGDRLAALLLRHRLRHGCIPESELKEIHRIWEKTVGKQGEVPRHYLHREIPPFFTLLARAWLALGEPIRALSILESQLARSDIDYVTRRHAEEARLAIIRRMRLAEHWPAVKASLSQVPPRNVWGVDLWFTPIDQVMGSAPRADGDPEDLAASWDVQSDLGVTSRARLHDFQPPWLARAAQSVRERNPSLALELDGAVHERRLLEHPIHRAVVTAALGVLTVAPPRELMTGDELWRRRLWFQALSGQATKGRTEILAGVGARAIAEWALEKGETLALRLPHAGELLLQQARECYQEALDPVGAFLASLNIGLTRMRTVGRDDSADWINGTLRSDYEALRATRRAWPAWEELGSKGKPHPSPDWKNWFQRLELLAPASGNFTPSLSASVAPLEIGAVLARLDRKAMPAIPASINSKPPLSRQLTTWGCGIPAAVMTLMSFIALVSFGLVMPQLMFLEVGTIWSSGSVIVFGLLLTVASLCLVCRSFWFRFMPGRREKLEAVLAQKSQFLLEISAEPTAGTFLLHVVHRQIFREGRPWIQYFTWPFQEQVRESRQHWTVTPGIDHAPNLEELRQWQHRLGQRPIALTLKCDPVAQRVAWERWIQLALQSGQPAEVSREGSIDYFRCYRFGQPKSGLDRWAEPGLFLSIAGAEWAQLGIASWNYTHQRNWFNQLVTFTRLVPRQPLTKADAARRIKRQPAAACVLHLVGRPVQVGASARLKIAAPDANTLLAFQEFVPGPLREGTEILLSADQLPLNHLRLVVVQAEPSTVARWTQEDREQTERLRAFAATLFDAGAQAVLMIPTLPRALAGTVLSTIFKRQPRGRRVTAEALLPLVEHIRQEIAATQVGTELRVTSGVAQIARRQERKVTPLEQVSTPTPSAGGADFNESRQLASEVTLFARTRLPKAIEKICQPAPGSITVPA